MTLDYLLGLVAFVIATSATPGPNTMMLLASGMNFGFRATFPHMVGICSGFGGLLAAVGLGLGSALAAAPRVSLVLKCAAVIYMAWLAWRIANSGPAKGAESGARPLSFIEAALFQLVNPKAWAIAISVAAAYTRPEALALTLATMVGCFVVLNLPIAALWTAFGVALQTWLREPRRARLFNGTMAILLLASLAPIVADIAVTLMRR